VAGVAGDGQPAAVGGGGEGRQPGPAPERHLGPDGAEVGAARRAGHEQAILLVGVGALVAELGDADHPVGAPARKQCQGARGAVACQEDWAAGVGLQVGPLDQPALQVRPGLAEQAGQQRAPPGGAPREQGHCVVPVFPLAVRGETVPVDVPHPERLLAAGQGHGQLACALAGVPGGQSRAAIPGVGPVGALGQRLGGAGVPQAQHADVAVLDQLPAGGDQQEGLAGPGRGEGQGQHRAAVSAELDRPLLVGGVEQVDGPLVLEHGRGGPADAWLKQPDLAEPGRLAHHPVAGDSQPAPVGGQGQGVEGAVGAGADGHPVGGPQSKGAILVEGPGAHDFIEARGVERLAAGAKSQSGDRGGGPARLKLEHRLLRERRQLRGRGHAGQKGQEQGGKPRSPEIHERAPSWVGRRSPWVVRQGDDKVVVIVTLRPRGDTARACAPGKNRGPGDDAAPLPWFLPGLKWVTMA
jgi:hypothetical protein